MKNFLERLFPTLRWKVGISIIIVLLIADGGFIFFAQKTGTSMLEEQAQLKARAITDVMKSVVEQAMLSGDSNRIQQVLNDITRSSSVKNAFLLRPDGELRRESKSSRALDDGSLAVVHAMKRLENDDHSSASDNDSMYAYVISPLKNKPECAKCHTTSASIIGYVGLKLATEDFRTLALQHRKFNIILTVITFLGLGGIMFVALLFFVIRPIHGLHSHIRRIDGGMSRLESGERAQFPLLPESRQRDEIADLCRDFNNMMRRLNEANQKILELHSTELEQANRLATTGEMAASMAHEIKNPVAGVLGALQVIQSDLPPDNRQYEIFREMRTQLERVIHALNDLLTYARPTPPVFEDVDITALIDRTQSLLIAQFRNKAVDVRVSHRTRPIMLVADRKQLQQLLWNLMLNAIQAVDPPGSVQITSERSDQEVIVSVADTGKGIPPEDLERIFKPFFTTKHKGTGLGMTISRRIVDVHHGSMVIASVVQHGTTVTFRIPTSQPEA